MAGAYVITAEELRRIMPHAGARANVYVGPLNFTMAEFYIDNPLREAAFLAQVAQESGELRYVRELATGAAYDTGRLAARLGNTPEDDNDGERYKGRGLGQLTGTDNYRACGLALGLDLLGHPELLEQPLHAARSFGWFWQSRGLNELADRGNFLLITKRIVGGIVPTTHYDRRLAYYQRALQVFSAEAMNR